MTLDTDLARSVQRVVAIASINALRKEGPLVSIGGGDAHEPTTSWHALQASVAGEPRGVPSRALIRSIAARRIADAHADDRRGHLPAADG